MVGANIVNGPFPDKVAIKSVVCLMSVKAATKLVNTSLFKAKATTLGGNITLSITCTVPLLASTSTTTGAASPLNAIPSVTCTCNDKLSSLGPVDKVGT